MISIAGPNASGRSGTFALLRRRRRLVDYELVGHDRVGERYVSKEVPLAEQRDAVSFVILVVGRTFWAIAAEPKKTDGGQSLVYSEASPKTRRPVRFPVRRTNSTRQLLREGLASA